MRSPTWLAIALIVWSAVLGLAWLRIHDFSPEVPAYMAIGSLLVWSAFFFHALAPRLPVNRWGWLGFLGAWFFMTLAPSSSVVPIATEMAAERRIYLALAAVVVLVLVGVETLRRSADDPSDARARSCRTGTLAAVTVFYLWVSGWLTHRWVEAYRTPTMERLAVLFAAEWTVRLTVAVSAAIGAYILIRARPTVRAALAVAIVLALAVTSAVRGSMYSDTEAIWGDVTVKIPENARGWNNLGITRVEKGSIVEGKVALQRAIAAGPGFRPAWAWLAALARSQGRKEEEERLLEQMIVLEPNHAPSLSRLGELLVDMGRPREAIPYLERAVAARPSAEDWTMYGTALAQSGQHDRALSAFDNSLLVDPYQAAAHLNKGSTLVSAGRYADAVPVLRAALERDPLSVVAQTNLAMAYAGLGQADQAIRAGRQAIALSPQSPQLHAMLGGLLNRFGRVADAEQQLTLAVQLLPDDPDSLFQLGVVRTSLGKRDEAIAAFRQALRVNADYRPAREALERLGAAPPR